jgi:hypothetical protein
MTNQELGSVILALLLRRRGIEPAPEEPSEATVPTLVGAGSR